jgi:repressor LexA
MRNDRTHEILGFIERFSRERGFPPTIREIGKAFGIASTNGVRYHLHRLEKDGHLRRSGKISRGIESMRSNAHGKDPGIPILGRVAAGQPILAEECYEGRLETDHLFGESGELFALRVRGDSMIDAGVFENDYVVVRQQDTAAAGEMVVAMIDDEATVKFYRPGANAIELVPANARYRPIVVERGEEFRLLGVVRGVVRTIGN